MTDNRQPTLKDSFWLSSIASAIPEFVTGSVLGMPPDPERIYRVIRKARLEGFPAIVALEKVVPLVSDFPKGLLIAEDLICTFDPTLLPVRDDQGGTVFPDLTHPIHARLVEEVEKNAMAAGSPYNRVCMAGLRGLGLFTEAEKVALQRLGAGAACAWLHYAIRWANALRIPIVAIGLPEGWSPDPFPILEPM